MPTAVAVSPVCDCDGPSVRLCAQPIRLGPLTNSRVPAWADAFITAIPMPQLVDLIEAATTMQIKMWRVCARSCVGVHVRLRVLLCRGRRECGPLRVRLPCVRSCVCVCRLEMLGCARIAQIVKSLPPGKLQEIYGITTPMSPEEEKELKAANEWAWKIQEPDVVDDEEEEGVEGAAPAVAAAGGAPL